MAGEPETHEGPRGVGTRRYGPHVVSSPDSRHCRWARRCAGCSGPSYRSLLGALRANFEAVVAELVLPVLPVELPHEVLVIDDDGLLRVVGGDAVLARLRRDALGLRVQDLDLDLDAVAAELLELADEAVDALLGELAGVGLGERLLQRQLGEHLGGDL